MTWDDLAKNVESALLIFAEALENSKNNDYSVVSGPQPVICM
jgi:hypothetical protein